MNSNQTTPWYNRKFNSDREWFEAVVEAGIFKLIGSTVYEKIGYGTMYAMDVIFETGNTPDEAISNARKHFEADYQ